MSDLIDRKFSIVAKWCAVHTGRAYTFMAAVGFILLWATLGPVFQFSDTWQLVINTSTTIITFLMMFIIQYTQNRDTAALHAKLDGLISASKRTPDLLIGVENLSEQEITQVKDYVQSIRQGNSK